MIPRVKVFYGSLSNNNTGDAKFPCSVVMVSGHLGTYSAGCMFFERAWPALLVGADYAYAYLCKNFLDKQNSGVYWSMAQEGKPVGSWKQIYGEAFTAYGRSEFASAVAEFRNRKVARAIMDIAALAIFNLMETNERDWQLEGYCEALSVNRLAIADTKLSPVDIDCDKSMNTNLYVMEAWTSLLRAVKLPYPQFTTLHDRVYSFLGKPYYCNYRTYFGIGLSP
jgi:mannobiose 2-epimerase